ncbi:MAG: hypothetical protein FGM52_01370 [Mycobacterium sp.]|nr:hypothetical protein [Mycobacterium sp.]
MNITSRSYLTAGIAALGVGAIALTPIQPLPGQAALAPQRAVSNLAVELASSINPIEPWINTFQTSFANIQKLFNFYAASQSYTSPLGLGTSAFPLIQTIIANQVTYFQEAFSGNIGLIPGQILGNVQKFFNAPWSPGDPVGEYISGTSVSTIPVVGLPLSQQTAFALLPGVLGEETYTALEPLINFTSTYYSGQVVGLLGPLFAPLIELTRSFTAIGEFFQAGDVIGAINELINIPANVTNAVLNGGGFLDLTGVANALGPLPPEVKKIGLNLGGLISPPVPQNGSILPEGTAPTEFDGGVAFDSLAFDISYKISNLPPPNGTSVNVSDPAIPVSWIGAVIGLGQFLGDEMVVTPPAPPTAAAEPVAAKLAAPVDLPAPALTEATPALDPAPVEDSVESAPAVVDLPEQEAPADFAADPAPEPAVAAVADIGADDAGASEAGGAAGDTGDNGSRAGDSRRGARDAD